jgi:hypothetical protein
VSAREWLPPLAVGTAVDPVFHHDEPWGFWGWLFYYADRWWLPTAGTPRWSGPGSDRRVPADVVEVKLRLAGDETGTRVVGTTVTVSFADLAGVRHWVTRGSRETDVSGAEVLFDPAHPGDEKSIFVALRRHPALADWLPAGRVPSRTRSTS